MPNYVYPAIGLIGGTAGFLDAIDGTNLADKDMAMVAVQGDKTYFYVLDVDSAAAEASPGIIAPDANGGDKRWILTGFTPVPAATGWTGAGGTTSKTLTVSASEDTKNIIRGDGNAGRSLRQMLISVLNGTVAATIKPSTSSLWNGNTNAAEDNLAKGGSGTAFALNAGGNVLSILVAGLTDYAYAILSVDIANNLCGTALVIDRAIAGDGIDIYFRDVSTGANLDVTTLVDTGAIYLSCLYITGP